MRLPIRTKKEHGSGSGEALPIAIEMGDYITAPLIIIDNAVIFHAADNVIAPLTFHDCCGHDRTPSVIQNRPTSLGYILKDERGNHKWTNCVGSMRYLTPN